MVYRLSGKKPDEMSTPLTEEEEQEMYDQFNKMDLNDNNAFIKMPENQGIIRQKFL